MKKHPKTIGNRKRHRAARPKPGSPPGTLAAHPEALATRITLHQYGPSQYQKRTISNAHDLRRFKGSADTIWVEVSGLADTAVLLTIGKLFEISALSLENAIDPSQRGKVERYNHYTVAIIKALESTSRIETQQLSLFVGEKFLLTLMDIAIPALVPVRDRLCQPSLSLRSHSTDFLAYAIIDSVVDHYFPIMEQFDDHLESVEDAVMDGRNTDLIDLTKVIRQDLQTIRHAVWSARDVIRSLLEEDTHQFSKDTRLHLKDCYDHVIQLQIMVESSREIAASLLESYISRISLQTNEVMKVLTVIATIFIPLTFITGLYGMNFNPKSSPFNMPELNWYWGYPLSLLVMMSTVIGFLSYFRRKGWFDHRKK